MPTPHYFFSLRVALAALPALVGACGVDCPGEDARSGACLSSSMATQRRPAAAVAGAAGEGASGRTADAGARMGRDRVERANGGRAASDTGSDTGEDGGAPDDSGVDSD